MIDTVVLKIRKYQNIQGVGIPEWELNSSYGGHYSKRIKRQTKSQRKDNVYRPRVTGIKRGSDKFVQFEFSIPKLLHGNNVDEVTEDDFADVLSSFTERAKDMGIVLKSNAVRMAQVSTLHVSKNILLKDGYTTSAVLRELKKIDISRQFDLTEQKFRNGGESIQCYSKNHSFVMYDKIKDLKKDQSRAIDKDQVSSQKGLFDKIDTQILRLEARLPNRKRIKKMLRVLGINDNKTHFEDVFNKELCQKIVRWYWEQMVSNSNLFLFGLDKSPDSVLERITRNDEGITPKHAIFLVGLHQLCTEGGMRKTRDLVELIGSRRTWYRYDEYLDVVREVMRTTATHGWVQQIESQITNFEPVRLSRVNI